jgi:hypothetical protein
MRKTSFLASRSILFVLVVSALSGCGEDASHARRQIREVHVPEVKAILAEDRARHRRGVRTAAERLAPGFAIEAPADRESQLRTAMRYIQQPPRGVPELIASPMTFMAAVGIDGIVIARDVREAADDRMKGEDFAARYPVVRTALEAGQPGYALGEFPAESGPPSFSMLFVAPARRAGEVVGAVVIGIPLRSMAARLGRQLALDHPETDLQFWVYATVGDTMHYTGTPELLDPLVPEGAARRAGLERSPGGYTGEVELFDRPFGYGVLPTPSLGPDVGFVIFRSDPVH